MERRSDGEAKGEEENENVPEIVILTRSATKGSKKDGEAGRRRARARRAVAVGRTVAGMDELGSHQLKRPSSISSTKR